VCVCVCVFLVFLCLLLFVNLSALTGEIKISIIRLIFHGANTCTKFEVSSSSRSRDISGV